LDNQSNFCKYLSEKKNEISSLFCIDMLYDEAELDTLFYQNDRLQTKIIVEFYDFMKNKEKENVDTMKKQLDDLTTVYEDLMEAKSSNEEIAKAKENFYLHIASQAPKFKTLQDFSIFIHNELLDIM
jgi:hypothetical protein